MEVTSPTSIAFPLEVASSIGVFGPSFSGKSTLVRRLLENKHDMFVEPPLKILYCYGIWTDAYNSMEKSISGINFYKGLPSLEEVEAFADGCHNLVILDDLVHEICASTWTDKLFTMCAHHLKLSIIFMSQNLYPQGAKHFRNITLNLKYIILFRSPRDQQQVGLLGTQLGSRQKLLAAYSDAVLKQKFGYLVLDLTPTCDNEYRWRTNIFPGENTIIYK